MDKKFKESLKKIMDGDCDYYEYLRITSGYSADDERVLITGARLRLYLDSYEQNIDRIGLYKEVDPTRSRSLLSYTYILKYEIALILEYFKETVDIAPYGSEFDPHTRKLKIFEKENSKAIGEELYNILNSIAKIYPRSINYFAIYSADREGEDILDTRDAMEILLEVLKNEFGRDLGDIEKEVRALDAELYNIIAYDIDEILRGNEKAWYEFPYYPDRFWWRHPSAILKEKEGARHGAANSMP